MGRRGMHVGFWWESQKERDHWEDLDAGGRIMLKWASEKWDWCGMVLIHLDQDRDQWRSLVNKVINFGKFLSSSATGRLSRTHVRGVSLV
jgi:hypothetical protein